MPIHNNNNIYLSYARDINIKLNAHVYDTDQRSFSPLNNNRNI